MTQINTSKPHIKTTSKLKKTIYSLVGLLATALAIIGVFLPGVPTTIFVLVALWAFSNTNERLQDWFLRLPILRTAIREAHTFQQEKTVALSSKVISQACAWGSSLLVFILSHNLVATFICVGFAISCTVFMLWIPTRQPKPATEP